MTSVADNRERGIDVEDESCQQWPLRRAAEDRREWFDLAATDSWYILSVIDREAEYILRMAVVRASRVNQLIGDRWTDCRRGGNGVEQYRQFPWSAVFDPTETPGGEQA
jgi:hypothetical protein